MTAARRNLLAGSAAAALLLLSAPTPGEALRALHTAGEATDPVGPLVAALSLSAWALAVWLGVTVLLTAAGRLPGTTGRLCEAVSRRVAPAAFRRGAEVVLGLSVAASALGTTAASAHERTAAAPPPAVTAAVPVSLDWSPATGPAQAAAPSPSLDWPGSRAASASAVPRTGDPVVVRPGDTLWGLAHRALREAGDPAPSAAEVAQAWPAWWAANRDVVGDDPDLIRPGTDLTRPTDA